MAVRAHANMQTFAWLYFSPFCTLPIETQISKICMVVGRNAQQCSFCYMILWALWEEQSKIINHVFIIDKVAVNRYLIFLKRI